jgi:hypothetical protein
LGLERGPLSLVSTIEELLGRKSNGSDLEIREYCCRDPSRRPRGTLYQHKLALTSPTSCGHSVDIVRWRTQATEFFFSSLIKNDSYQITLLSIWVEVGSVKTVAGPRQPTDYLGLSSYATQ